MVPAAYCAAGTRPAMSWKPWVRGKGRYTVATFASMTRWAYWRPSSCSGPKPAVATTAGGRLLRCGILTNCMAPGLARSDGTLAGYERAAEAMGTTDKTAGKGMMEFQPTALGSTGKSGEVAGAITFPSSGAATWITGAELFVDGGTIRVTALSAFPPLSGRRPAQRYHQGSTARRRRVLARMAEAAGRTECGDADHLRFCGEVRGAAAYSKPAGQPASIAG